MNRWKFFCSIAALGFVCAGFAGAAYAAGPAPAAAPKPAAPAVAAPKPAAPAPTAPAAPKVLATADGDVQGMRLEVTQLKRVGSDAVMLKFTVYNDGDKQYSSNTFDTHEYNSTDGVYLVDLDGKKKYEVMKDSDDHCVCSRGMNSIDAHTNVILWAKFGAPPDTTTKLGVVVPHFTPMDDVPLTPR